MSRSRAPTRTKPMQVGPVLVEREFPMQLVVWIDTSVVLTWLQMQAGRAAAPRLERLINALKAAVGSGVAIVVESQQVFEVKGPGWERFRDQMYQLTLGCRFKYPLAVEEAEISRFLRGWFTHNLTVDIPHASVYAQSRPSTGQYHITVTMGNEVESHGEMIDIHHRTAAKVEEWRKDLRASGVTFRDQLPREREGWLNAMFSEWNKGMAALKKGNPSYEDLLRMEGIERFDQWYRSLAAKNEPPGKFYDFFHSVHGLAIPSHLVRTTLWADVVTGSDPVKSGDAADIDHLTIALPWSDIVVCDAHMKARIERRKLHRLLSTDVYSLRDADKLSARLEQLVRDVEAVS